MALQTHSSSCGNRFFARTAEVAIDKSIGYVLGNNTRRDEAQSISEDENDLISVIGTSRVCKGWQKDPVMQKYQDLARYRLRMLNLRPEFIAGTQYPKFVARALRNCGILLHNLPELNVATSTMAQTVFITSRDMTHPIMRFKDSSGISGIALNLKAKNPPLIASENMWKSPITTPIDDSAMHGNDTVVECYSRAGGNALFFSSSSEEDIWLTPTSNNAQQAVVFAGCTDIPFSDRHVMSFDNHDVMTDLFFQNVLKDQDPLFRLADPTSNRFSVKTVVIATIAMATFAYGVHSYFTSK